jgi:hypothetical protein
MVRLNTVTNVRLGPMTRVPGSEIRATREVILFALGAAVLLLALAAAAYAQLPATRFDPVLENPQVSVYSLELPAGRRASVFQNTHDIFWIALTPGRVTMSGEEGRAFDVSFRPGEARFVSSFRTRSISNESFETFRAVLVEVKPRGLASSCDCDGFAQRAVCGCPRAAPLPAMWAVAVGRLIIGGTTLSPGDGFYTAGERGDTLLVAISPLSLADDASPPLRIRLRSGQVQWIPRGLHKFRNIGSTPARYVTLEF